MTMLDNILDPRDMDFLLYEFLNTELLLNRTCYAGHSTEIFSIMLEKTRQLANSHFANHYLQPEPTGSDGLLDTEFLDIRQAELDPLASTAEGWGALTQLGILSAHHRIEAGGMQLPDVICAASRAYLNAANFSASMLHNSTIAVANVINRLASDEQKALFLPSLLDGSFSATMAFTEPDQGSWLLDISTTAIEQSDGSYLLSGRKSFVNFAEHNITKNIVHLLLAKNISRQSVSEREKNVSLFIVPRQIIHGDGSWGALNDIQVVELHRKMGCQNAPSAVLDFGGSKGGATGYLIGNPARGIEYLFEMLNQSRLAVGLSAAALACRSYLTALNYARKRTQGCLLNQAKSNSTQVEIIQHADVRRMLLQQKCYAEGAMALSLYVSSLVEDVETAETEPERQRAAVLLDLLTPVVKAWPAKYGAKTCDLAMQVLGGYGYLREYMVEQLYRDQRVNSIREGTEAMQALDLLGRKIVRQDGYGLDIFSQEVRITLQRVEAIEDLVEFIDPMRNALECLNQVTEHLHRLIERNPERGMADANLYLDSFSRVVIGWTWLRQALVACRALSQNITEQSEEDVYFYQGKLQATRYYFDRELPLLFKQAEFLEETQPAFYTMRDEWF